jgi:hypothetical protein
LEIIPKETGSTSHGVARLSGFQLSRDTFEEGIAEGDDNVAFRAGQTTVSDSTVSVFDPDALDR